MSLGERLKKARLDRGLSQSQVAGEQITRNMLSQLEHDQASPSVKTLEYLASVLGVRISWLLEEQPVDSDARTEEARSLYQAGNFRDCAALLQQADRLTPEGGLLLCRSALQCSSAALRRGDLSAAEQYANLALSVEGLYIGIQESLAAHMLLADCAMTKGVSAEHWMKLVQDQSRDFGLEDERHLLTARYHLLGDRLQDAEKELWLVAAATPESKGEYLLLRGWLAVLKERYQDAILYLRQAEEGTLRSVPQKLELCRLLETCFREREDYKQAYHYASLRLAAGAEKSAGTP